VWSAREHKRIRKHFGSLREAKDWRSDSYGKLRRREMRAPTAMTLQQAAERWLHGARAGSIPQHRRAPRTHQAAAARRRSSAARSTAPNQTDPYAYFRFLTAPYFRRAARSHPARFPRGFPWQAFKAAASF
jgi:hypothetical protein